jgi:hypothetical protein
VKEESYTRKIEIAVKPAELFRGLTTGVEHWWTTSADDASTAGKKATRFDESYQTMAIREHGPALRLECDCDQVRA